MFSQLEVSEISLDLAGRELPHSDFMHGLSRSIMLISMLPRPAQCFVPSERFPVEHQRLYRSHALICALNQNPDSNITTPARIISPILSLTDVASEPNTSVNTLGKSDAV